MFFRDAKNNGLDDDLFEAIQDLNERSSFHDLLDLYIVQLEPGEATVEIPIQKEHMNNKKITHGGVTFSLLDAAMGLAVCTLNVNSVTMEANINYLRPALQSDNLTAIGKVISLGRKIIVTEGFIKNKAGEKVAVARGTYFNIGQIQGPEEKD